VEDGAIPDNISEKGFNFLLRKDRIHVPHPIPVPETQTAFHRRLFWTGMLVRMLLITPFCINLAHGVVVLTTLQPRALGVAILLFGSLGYLGFWSIGQFIYSGYKPNKFILDTLLLILVTSIAYMYIAIASDPIPFVNHLASFTAVSATASFLPMVLLIFLNTEALSDSIVAMQGLSKVLRQEEEADAERIRKEAKKKSEETGKNKSESSFEMKAAKKKAEEASISITAALGVPPEVAPALGSVLGTAALVCYDYAIDPNKSVIPPEVDEKNNAPPEEEPTAMGKQPKQRTANFRNKSSRQLFEGEDENEESEEPPDPKNTKNPDNKITPGVAGFMSKKGPEWESAYRKQLEAHLGHLAEEVLQREKALAAKLEEEKKAKEAEYRAVIEQAAAAALADAQRSKFAKSGVSLGLSEQDDTILRLTSVASAPWLQPQEEGFTRPFSNRSPTHILGSLLGQRVFSLLGSAPTEEMQHADGFNDTISLHPSVIKKLSRVCILISFTIMLIHAIIVGLFFPLFWYDGAITAASLALQDWTAYCLVTSFLLNRGPVYFTLLLASSRGVIVWYCGNTWFGGQALAYVIWGVALGYEAGIHRLPDISATASEFICYLGLFQLGKEYADAVTKTNEAARTFQEEVARFFGVDLKRNYLAEEEAARRRRKARLKKGKAADDDDDDDEDDENDDKDDPYSMQKVKEREVAKKELEEKTKTPLASRYMSKERTAAPTNADGTTAEGATDYGIGRKDETKVVRTAAARLLNSTVTQPGKSKDKAAAAAEARAAAIAAASKRVNTKTASNKKAKSNQVVPINEEDNGGGNIDAMATTAELPADTSAVTMAAYARRHRKIARSFLSEVLQCREAWSALLVLTAAYIPVLIACIAFYEVQVAWANAQPKYEAGIFDSEVVYLVPSINLFGVVTKVWIVGIAALAAVTLNLFISATITAFRLRGKGLLPTSFDILLPFVSKRNKDLRRIPYPEFMAILTQFTGMIYGIVFYFITNSGTVLVLSITLLPILSLIGYIGVNFVENGYNLLQPGRFRPKMSVAYLLELNARAGYPLADRKYLNQWRNKISVEDGYLLHKIEFGPGGHGTSVFTHPVARGEGYTPGADITAVDLYGNGSSFAKENMDFINRSAKDDEARRKHNVQASASLYAQNKNRPNPKDGPTGADTSTPNPNGDEIKDGQSQRVVQLQQQMLKRGEGICSCFSRFYYRWKLRQLSTEHMSFMSALFRGYLTTTDISVLYATISLFTLVLLTGVICAFATTSPIIGHSLWFGFFIVFTSAPVVATYVQVAHWTHDMLVPIIFSYIMTGVGIGLMLVELFLLQGPDERTIYATACAGGYWGLLVGIMGFTKWSRNDYRFQRSTIYATLYFYVSMSGVNFAIYGWTNFYVGVAVSLVLFAVFTLQFGLWLYHGYNGYIPPGWRRFVYTIMILTTLGAIFIGISQDINLFYCFSVGFLFLLLRYGGRAIVRLLSLDEDSPLVCGPLIFPLFSYDIDSGQPRSEDIVGVDVGSSILILFSWGIFAMMFVDPLFTGVSMVCGTIMLATIIVARTSIHTPLSIGSFAPYIDTDAVRGARTIATNTFFSRRVLAPVEKMLNTAEGASVMDGFSNAMLSDAAYEKAERDRERALQAKKLVQGETGKNAEEEDDTVVEDVTTGRKLHVHSAKGGLKALDAEDIFATLNRSLSFLDPSQRDATTIELASHGIGKMNAGRDTCAKGMAQMACMQWCINRAWPWQIPENQFNKELFISLLSRLQVSAEEIVKTHEHIISSVNCECMCLSASRKAEEVEKRLQVEIRKYVTHAAAELAYSKDVSDLDDIAETLEDAELMIQPLTDFTQAMINVIRKKSLLTKAEERRKLQEAQEWLENNVTNPLSPGTSNAANVTPARPIAPMLGAIRRNEITSGSKLSDISGSGRRGFSASPSIRNLNAELNPSASVKAELNKLVAGSNQSSTRSLTGSTTQDANKAVPTATPLRSVSAGPTAKLQRGDTLRALEKVAKAATAINAFQSGVQDKNKPGNQGNAAIDVKNAREARKKGGNTNTDPTGAMENVDNKSKPVAVSEVVVGRRKQETVSETVYRKFREFIGYFIGTPPEAIPPPIQPAWQADIARGDALASDEFKRTKAKKSVVYYALTSYLAYMDTAQLASFLVHPLYTPIDRPDRPWTWKEAIADGFMLGDGPIGFVVLYGFLFDIVRFFLRGIKKCCRFCQGDFQEKHHANHFRRKRSAKGWKKTNFPTRMYSRDQTVGCCGRRAPIYASNALPPEHEIDRLAQQYKDYTGQPIRIVTELDDTMRVENFPDTEADPSITLTIDGTPVRTAPPDFHGITQKSRSNLFGFITRAKGWIPERISGKELQRIFVAGNTDGKTNTFASPTRDSSVKGILSNRKGNNNDSAGDPVDVSGTENESKPTTAQRPRAEFHVSRDKHGILTVKVGTDGGRTLGIEEPVTRASAPVSHTQIYAGILEAQRTIGIEYYEEIRALLHFQMLLASYGRARLQSHRSRYPYFVDIVTKTLKTAGATLPVDGKPLYKDLVNTACWLSTLDTKYQLLYRKVKFGFDTSMRLFKQNQLLSYKALVASKIRRDAELEHRAHAFVEAHNNVSRAIASTLQAKAGEAAHKRAQKEAAEMVLKQAEGTYIPNNDDVTAVGELAKLESFNVSEIMVGRILVHEVEKLKKNCSLVAGGRMRPHTFVDPDFLPDNNTSIGELNPARLSEMLSPAWRLAPAFNREARLFTSGSDPDDVIQGFMLKDGWLMSSIAMLAASGGVSDNSVDPLIDNIFITKRESNTGVYALRLCVHGHWISILLDDSFPVLGDAFRAEWSRKTPKCKGAATAHARDFGELWVPLIEKAMAKLYGGYGELNRGYVEHGLQILTGAETIRLPLQVVVDGPFRARLWKEMVRNIKECGYLLGAETFGVAAAMHVPTDKDKLQNPTTIIGADGLPMVDLLPNGLAPASVYLIYDIQQVGNQRLVQLREPPSVKSNWKGDFSATSEAWTSRLISQLNWSAISDEENRTFWMSFDDFCNNFQSLYTCRVMDGERWFRFTAAGAWLGPTAAGLLKELNEPPKTTTNAASLDSTITPDNEPQSPPQGIKRPSKHKKYGMSEIHSNPQFALDITHSTSICITLHQAPFVDEGSKSNDTVLDVQPVTIYIVNRAGEDDSRLDLAAYNAQVNAQYIEAAGEIRQTQRGLNSGTGDIANFGTTFHLPTDKNIVPDENIDFDEDMMETGKPTTDITNGGAIEVDDQPNQMIKEKKVKRNAKAERITTEKHHKAHLPPRDMTEAELEIARSALGKETGTATSLWDENIVAPFMPKSDGRVYALTSSNIVATSGAPVSRDTVRVYAHLPAGRYVILPATLYAGQEGMFGLVVEATSEVSLSQLWPPLVSSKVVDAHLAAKQASAEGKLQGSNARAADAAIEAQVDKLMHAYGFGEYMRKKHEKDNSIQAQLLNIWKILYADVFRVAKLSVIQSISAVERGLGIGGDVQCYSQIKTLKMQEVQHQLDNAKTYNRAFDEALRLAESSPGGASTIIYEPVNDDDEVTEKFMQDYDLPLFRHWGDDAIHINEIVDANELSATLVNSNTGEIHTDLGPKKNNIGSTRNAPTVWAADNSSSSRPSSRGTSNLNNPPIVTAQSSAAVGFDN